MLDSTYFWAGFLAGTVAGAVGYRLYEQYQGQLHQLVREKPLDRMDFAANGIKKGIETTTHAAHISIDKASELAQATIDKAVETVKELIEKPNPAE